MAEEDKKKEITPESKTQENKPNLFSGSLFNVAPIPGEKPTTFFPTLTENKSTPLFELNAAPSQKDDKTKPTLGFSVPPASGQSPIIFAPFGGKSKSEQSSFGSQNIFAQQTIPLFGQPAPVTTPDKTSSPKTKEKTEVKPAVQPTLLPGSLFGQKPEEKKTEPEKKQNSMFGLPFGQKPEEPEKKRESLFTGDKPTATPFGPFTAPKSPAKKEEKSPDSSLITKNALLPKETSEKPEQKTPPPLFGTSVWLPQANQKPAVSEPPKINEEEKNKPSTLFWNISQPSIVVQPSQKAPSIFEAKAQPMNIDNTIIPFKPSPSKKIGFDIRQPEIIKSVTPPPAFAIPTFGKPLAEGIFIILNSTKRYFQKTRKNARYSNERY